MPSLSAKKIWDDTLNFLEGEIDKVISEYEVNLTQLQDEKDALTRKYEALSRENFEKQTLIKQLEDKVKTQDFELTDLKNSLKAGSAVNSSQSTEIAQLKQRLTQAELKAKAAEEEKETRVKFFEDRYGQLEQRCNRLEAELEQARVL